MELTLNDITDHLGQPRTKIGAELIWQCPYCMDKHADNLHYNERKNILWCFADEQHSKNILSEISRKKYEEKKMQNIEIPRYLKLQEQYIYYTGLCNDMLLGNNVDGWLGQMLTEQMFTKEEVARLQEISKSDKPQKARAYLKEQRGINRHTIELTGLGFDFIEGKWVIPIFNMNTYIVGFEYRAKNFKDKKIWREIGCPSCLAHVYGNGKKAIIQEGFLDSYCTVQMLDQKGTLDEYSIFTTSSGVASTPRVITQLQFGRYDSIRLILDNDEAGDKVTNEITSKYSFIKDGRGFLRDSRCKDMNEYMLEMVNND